MVSISECQVDKLGEKGESSNEKNVCVYGQNFRTWSKITITICIDRHRQFILLGEHTYAFINILVFWPFQTLEKEKTNIG